jgi:GTP cyclohydrolase II
MEMIQKDGRGVLLYLNKQEGRGIGLLNKIGLWVCRIKVAIPWKRI